MRDEIMKPLALSSSAKMSKTVFYFNSKAGCSAISSAADDRFTIVRNIIEVLSLSVSSDLSAVDMPNLFGSLCTLLDEAQCLHNAAYEAALIEGRQAKDKEGEHATKP